MILTENLIITPNFDSGKFCNSFSIVKKNKDYGKDSNIQEVYNLTSNDFDNLSYLIGIVTEKFLENKNK